MTKVLLPLFTCLLLLSSASPPPDDSERLGMAIDYFQSGKYHEALLIFESLDREYRLNPRFHAYMGVCYFHEWSYEEACKFLDDAIPQLEGFAPHERSVYYFTDGESHFQLRQYAEAIPYYEQALTVCFENEKPEIYYRLGFCYMFAEKWEQARNYYQQALDGYLLNGNGDGNIDRGRILQIAHMMKGCESHLTPASLPDAIVEAPSSIDTISPVILRRDTVSPVALRRDTVRPVILRRDTVRRDTISSEVPEGINIEDIFQRQVEIKE